MRALLRGLLGLCLALTNLSCSVNVLENFADKNSNMALYYDALNLINEGDYNGALDKIALINGAFAVDRTVKVLRASAYSGLCGLVFFPLVNDLANLSTERHFPLLQDHFRAGTTVAEIDYCTTAEGIIESIGTTAFRTNDENMQLVLINFGKIGNILSYYADGNQDGATDAAYDVCTIGPTRTAGAVMPDVDATELAWSIVLAINNITAVSSSVNLGNSALASVSAACAALGALNPAYNFCGVTDRTGFTANHLKGIRSLVKEDQSVGLDTLQAGCNGDVATCNCP